MNFYCVRALLLTVLLPLAIAPTTHAQEIRRINLGPGGEEANGGSSVVRISGNGRFVVFDSTASNLVADDTNGLEDVFVADLVDGTISRVSVASNGDEGNSSSFFPSISDDGRYVLFSSLASNFAPTPEATFVIDTYVHDRETGTTTLVSVDSQGNRPADNRGYPRGLSGDGRFVAFEADFDDPSIDDTPGKRDAWLRNLDTGEITLLDQSSDGETGDDEIGGFGDLTLNTDGRLAGFVSSATNLVDGDTNGLTDIFVRDTLLAETRRVSLAESGEQLETGLSPGVRVDNFSDDDRYLSMGLTASEMGDPAAELVTWRVFRFDRLSESYTLVSTGAAGEANDSSLPSGMSGDGDVLAFITGADNLSDADANGLYDMYVHRVSEGRTMLISQGIDGAAGDGASFYGSLSRSGERMAFASRASNLVANDSNGVMDVFVAEVPPPARIFADRFQL